MYARAAAFSAKLADFTGDVAEELRRPCSNAIYGTVRLISGDEEIFLNWAIQSYAYIVFNLNFQHTESGIVEVADDLRYLTDVATGLGGGCFLTFSRLATRQVVNDCYPQFHDFLAPIDSYDRGRVFSSDWNQAYRCLN